MVCCSSHGCGPSPPVHKCLAVYNLRVMLQSLKTVAARRTASSRPACHSQAFIFLSHMLNMPCVIRRERKSSIPPSFVFSGHNVTTPVLCKLSSSAGRSTVRQHARKLIPPEKEGRTRANATRRAAQKDCPWMPAQDIYIFQHTQLGAVNPYLKINVLV